MEVAKREKMQRNRVKVTESFISALLWRRHFQASHFVALQRILLIVPTQICNASGMEVGGSQYAASNRMKHMVNPRGSCHLEMEVHEPFVA